MPRKPGYQLSELEILVDELMRSKPDQKKVKDLMLSQGLEYAKDPIQQMSRVLEVMNRVGQTLRREKEADL